MEFYDSEDVAACGLVRVDCCKSCMFRESDYCHLTRLSFVDSDSVDFINEIDFEENETPS